VRFRFYKNHKNAFTLVELLVVLSICSLLMGILLPALSKARRSVYSMLSKNNQRSIVMGVLCYSSDNDGQFPDSVAKLGPVNHWSWQEPTVLAGF
jgi:prepilin-type N-terminal cleavage/methylation domain-containing protein